MNKSRKAVKNRTILQVENLETIQLLSTMNPVTHAPKHPAHLAPHTSHATKHHVNGVNHAPVAHHTPHTATTAKHNRGPVNHVSPSAVQANIKIAGSLVDALTPPYLANAPYSIATSGRININGTLYNAVVAGTISSQTFTGSINILTSDGSLDLQVVALNNMKAAEYNVIGGTGNFANATGVGKIMFGGGSNVDFNPHEFTTRVADTKVAGSFYVSPVTSNWYFTSTSNINVNNTVYTNVSMTGNIVNGAGTIAISTSAGTLNLGVVTTYGVGFSYYTIISGTDDFSTFNGYGVMLVRQSINGDWSIGFNPHQY